MFENHPFVRRIAMNKQDIVDSTQFIHTVSRIAYEIVEKHDDLSSIVIVGIKRRGADIAHLLKEQIQKFTNKSLPSFDVDITLYRDDFIDEHTELYPTYYGATSFINIDNKTVILVDDVFCTGRTIRAALDALVSFGRAKRVELVAFIDRGHRELPIQADYVGKVVATTLQQDVQVHTEHSDGFYDVVLADA